MNKLLTRVTAPGQRPMSAQGGLARIFIKNLDLFALIGIHDHEKTTPQRLRINVDLGVREGRASITGDISDTVDYEKVTNAIRDLVLEDHVGLLETLAEDIAELCLATPGVMTARIRLEKLDAIDDAASVGIEIER